MKYWLSRLVQAEIKFSAISVSYTHLDVYKRQIDEYLGLETLKVVVRQPLVATETVDKFDVLVNVHGGGYTGQAGACLLYTSRCV